MQSVSVPLGGSQLLLTKAFQKGCSKQQISKPSTLRYSKAAGWGELAYAARCSSRRIQEKVSLDVARNGARKSRSSLRAAAETAETSVAETSAPADTASVTILLQKEAEFGFQFAVVGGDAALGDWNPAQAAVLDWAEGHIWSKTLDLPTNATIEYKFILVNNNMEAVEWQPGENRSLATSAGDGTVQGQWDEASESEDSSMDALMSEGDVSDEVSADGGGEEGASVEAATGEKTGAGTKERKQAPGGDDVSADEKAEDAEPSAEGALAEADVAPATTPAVEAAADAAADVGPPPASPKPSPPSPQTPAPVQEASSGGGRNLALAGASVLVALALSAAALFTPDAAQLIQRGDIKGAVGVALDRLHSGGLSEVAGSVGQHSSRILSSVSDKSGQGLEALNGGLGGLTKATGEGFGGLTRAAGEGLRGLSKATGESLEGLTKAASETVAGLTKSTGDGFGALTQASNDADVTAVGDSESDDVARTASSVSRAAGRVQRGRR